MTETMIADAALMSPQIIAVSNVVALIKLKRSPSPELLVNSYYGT
jgi:hypothetical protein